MQQKIRTLKIADLVEKDKMLKDIRDLNLTVGFKSPGSVTEDGVIFTFSKAAFNIFSWKSCGHTRVIGGF